MWTQYLEVPINCGTCKFSRFNRGNRQNCTLHKREMIDTDKCPAWQPTVVVPLSIFGQPLPVENRC